MSQLNADKCFIFTDTETSGLDINFEKLLEAQSSASPIDYFYNAVFGMSYAEKMRITEIELAEKRAEAGLGD